MTTSAAPLWTFSPRSEMSARENLRAFITGAKFDLSVFGADLDFEAPTWNVTSYIVLKGRKHNVRLNFSSWESSASKNWEPMQSTYATLTKAYVRYLHGIAPSKDIYGRIEALRAVCSACSNSIAENDPTLITADHINRAAQLLKGRYSPARAYRTSLQLEGLVDFLSKSRVLQAPFSWRTPVKRPKSGNRTGTEAAAIRDRKLPSAWAIAALTEIYRRATSHADVLVSSAYCVMCGAPERVNELLDLGVDCKIIERYTSTRGDSVAHGLRWHGSKGADAGVKWLATDMAEVCFEAIEKISRLTDSARELARWYEIYPGRIYLPGELEHLRGEEYLSLKEVGSIVFVEEVSKQSIRQWCQIHKVEILRRSSAREVVRFLRVQEVLLSLLPADFPWACGERGLKYSEALFVVHFHALHMQKTTYRCVLEKVTQGNIYNRMAREGSDSLFERFGFRQKDGEPILLRTHQLRTYLNTAAQKGGLSQDDIAQWSSRRDVKQNVDYDQESSASLVARIKAAVLEEDAASHVAISASEMQTLKEFSNLKISNVLVTDIGYCVHDYAMSSCDHFENCINCNEGLHVKGEKEKESRLRLMQESVAKQLERARLHEKNGVRGASKWVSCHENTLRNLDNVLSLVESPFVQNGAIIWPRGLSPQSSVALAHAGLASVLENPELALKPGSSERALVLPPKY